MAQEGATQGKPPDGIEDAEAPGKGFLAAGQRTFTKRLHSLGRMKTLRVLLYDFMVPPLDTTVECGEGMSTG